jgi:serine/threonine protein phosphatase 1
MPKTFVIGDIHGANRALVQCLQRAKFDYQNDHLISLGDVCDGWPDTSECIDELMRIKNLTYILGNHDVWTIEWMQTGDTDEVWLNQGGEATIQSYSKGIPIEHVQFLDDGIPYLIDNNRLFVHAGFDPKAPLESQGLDIFLWDRGLAQIALEFYQKNITTPLTSYEEVYIGHTPVPSTKPICSGGVWLMDTGAGWSGVLTIMNIDTKEIFASDPVPMLYPGIQARRK